MFRRNSTDIKVRTLHTAHLCWNQTLQMVPQAMPEMILENRARTDTWAHQLVLRPNFPATVLYPLFPTLKRLKANLLESLQLWVRHHRRSKLKLPNFVMCLSRSQTGAWWGECKVWGNDGVWKQWELTLVELQIKYYMPKSQLSIPLKNLLL